MAKTTSAKVYDILHRNIMNLTLIPGTPMSEKDISDKMSVSRTPVREAFIRLSKEALVLIVPQKGSFVSRISLSRVKEERFLRESLEMSVIEELILSKKPLDLSVLYNNLKEQRSKLEEQQCTEFLDLDDIFHASLFNLAGKQLSYEVMMSFSSHYRRLRLLSLTSNTNFMDNYKHHYRIVDNLESRDLLQAQSILKSHLRKVDAEKEDIYKQYPDYFEHEGDISLIDEKKLFLNMSK